MTPPTAPFCTDREDCHDHMRSSMRESLAPVVSTIDRIEAKLDHNGNRLTRVETVITLIGALAVMSVSMASCAINNGAMHAPNVQARGK